MAKFQVALSYIGSYFEEIIEIDADSIRKAKEKCDEIKLEKENYIENLKSRNVYCSKVLKDCKLHKITWEQHFLGCAEIGTIKLEDDV